MTKTNLIAAIENLADSNTLPGLPQKLPAAAILLLCERKNSRLLLTKRTQHLKHHPGEFCFPGGNFQQQDENLIITALRETQEELSINRNRVEIITALPKQVSKNRTSVFPLIAMIEQFEPMRADNNEVEQIVTVPLSRVLNPANYSLYLHQVNQVKIKSHRFVDPDYLIWGLTARVMIDFAKLYRSS